MCANDTTEIAGVPNDTTGTERAATIPREKEKEHRVM